MAAQRKVFQELGIQAIDCTPADMKFITRIHYAAPSDGGKWAEHEIDYILIMKQKKADHLRMDPNPEEVKNVMYLKLTDLEAFIGKKYAFKKYDQFALNISCICAVLRNLIFVRTIMNN